MKISPFSDGLSAVQKDGKWGYINTAGTLVIKNIYKHAQAFHDGIAVAKIDNKNWFIDKQGRKVLPLPFDRITYDNPNGCTGR